MQQRSGGDGFHFGEGSDEGGDFERSNPLKFNRPHDGYAGEHGHQHDRQKQERPPAQFDRDVAFDNPMLGHPHEPVLVVDTSKAAAKAAKAAEKAAAKAAADAAAAAAQEAAAALAAVMAAKAAKEAKDAKEAKEAKEAKDAKATSAKSGASDDGSAEADAKARASAAHDADELPPGWQWAQSDDGATYFTSPDGEATWADPRDDFEVYWRCFLVKPSAKSSQSSKPSKKDKKKKEKKEKKPKEASSKNAPLPPGWEQLKTEDGHTYYENVESGVTSWERPTQSEKEIEAAEMNAAVAEAADSGDGNLDPANWSMLLDAEENVLWVNAQTGATHPYKPTVVIDSESRAALKALKAARAEAAGWAAAEDDSGATYYSNSKSGDSSWSKPYVLRSLDAAEAEARIQPLRAMSEDWQQFLENGKTFYYNLRTASSAQTKPTEVVRFEQMEEAETVRRLREECAECVLKIPQNPAYPLTNPRHSS